MARILIVDDEAPLRRILAGVLRNASHEVLEAHDVDSALEVIGHEVIDLVLTDQKMGRRSGIDLISEIHGIDETTPVIMITAFASVDLAVDAMRAGAFDFIAKPFEPEVIRSSVRRAVNHVHLSRDNARLREEISRIRSAELVGECPAMIEIKKQIAKVAPTRATVLVQGETGTGKELVARALHASGNRASKPFIAVNCAAVTETLLESELFGHDQGAFTGAERTREGVFEAADGGTLFLDEAGDMPPSLQAKLLRVLMDGSFTRVGSTQERKTDVRVIAASHRDLPAAVRDGSFREDLYYRLAVVTLHVPALRDRTEDLELLCESLLTSICTDLAMPRKTLSPDALSCLRRYGFPGNVRELRNVLERAVILSDGQTISCTDMPVTRQTGPSATSPSGPADLASQVLQTPLPEGGLKALLEDVERDAILRTLSETGGVQAETARRLGYSKSDLFYRIQKYGLGEDSN